jgi:hypothetical protein
MMILIDINVLLKIFGKSFLFEFLKYLKYKMKVKIVSWNAVASWVIIL